MKKSAKPGAAVRASAARAIAQVLGGASLDAPLAQYGADLDPRDGALYRELCYGTLRQFQRLDAIVKRLLDRPLRNKEREVQALILIGLYQLSAMRIPAHAAVSATVDAAALLRKRQMGGLINAVLRRYQRESDTLDSQLTPSESWAQPEWLWDALGREWPEHREAIAEASNARPPMALRVNLAKNSRDAYLQTLAAADIEATPGHLSEAAVVLAQAQEVSSLPGFELGHSSVQDEAAQLAAIFLDPKLGENILDACAAPGGKTGHLLEHALQQAREDNQTANVTAMDISGERLGRVQENLERLELSALLVEGDGANPPSEIKDTTFDAMLVDVPCSATGVIRRHPDIKVLRWDTDAAGFAEQQRAILDGLWPMLARGGRLLYVTCSLLREENSAVVEGFCRDTTDAGVEEIDATMIPGDSPNPCLKTGVGIQILPNAEGGDGLFFALLRKQATRQR